MARDLPNIAHLYPGCVERLNKHGYHAIAIMAQHFKSAADLDRALGFKGASAHWLRGTGAISDHAKKASEMWVQLNLKQPAEQATPPTKTELVAEPVVATGQPDASMFMLVIPAGKTERVLKVLTMMGCEAVEV